MSTNFKPPQQATGTEAEDQEEFILKGGTPPLFTEAHATTIVGYARDKIEPHLLSVFDSSIGMLVTANTVLGVVTKWMVQAPMDYENAIEQTLGLGLDESQFTFLLLDSSTLVLVEPEVSH